MKLLKIKTENAGATQRAGHFAGQAAAAGDVILLDGPLGAGKTTFTQGLAAGLDIKESVMSPTFVLMRQLEGRLPLYHLDLYRLEALPEISDLGLDDYFYGRGVTVVEWADRAEGLMPEEHLAVSLKYTDSGSRRLAFTARGSRYEKMLEDIAAGMDNKL